MARPEEFRRSLEERVRRGRTMIYNDHWDYAADLVEICAKYMEVWSIRSDDAMRIPDVLQEASDYLRGFVDPNEEVEDGQASPE